MNNALSQNEIDKNAAGGTEIMHARLKSLVDPELLNDFQIVLSRFRGFDESKKHHIFWSHDLANDPESERIFLNQDIIQGFDAFVFVSYWQRNAFLDRFPAIPRNKCVVIRNAIDPIDIMQREVVDDKIRLIYTPTPHRGLEILVPVFEQLCLDFPDKLHLDVYSSFKLYGWEERDQPYQVVFDRINSHPNMTNHGTVSNEEIRKALLRSDIFAYPSIWQETSCLCLIEAMSAGCDCVCSDLAAIPETSGSLIPMYSYTGNLNADAESFYHLLKNIIQYGLDDDPIRNYQAQFNKTYIDALHNTTRMKLAWTHLLSTIKRNKQ